MRVRQCSAVFPPWLSGTGYLLSRQVSLLPCAVLYSAGQAAAELYNASLATPLLHLEDVFITGILAQQVLNTAQSTIHERLKTCV